MPVTEIKIKKIYLCQAKDCCRCCVRDMQFCEYPLSFLIINTQKIKYIIVLLI